MDLGLSALALAGPALVWLPATPVTSALGLAWSLFFPGWALICWPSRLPRGERAFLAVCLSAALLVLTGVLMSELGWAPRAALVTETLLAAGVCLVRPGRRLWGSGLPGTSRVGRPMGPGPVSANPPVAPFRDTGPTPRREVIRRWLLVGGAAVCVSSLTVVRGAVSRTPDTGLGLAPHLPPAAWLATGTAAVLCAASLGLRRHRDVGVVGATVLLAVATVGIPSIVYDAARLPTTWVHVGFVDALSTGAVPTGIDARFSWPGFFLAWAWRIEAAPGLSIDAVALWYPLAMVLLWCWGVYLLARRFGLSAGAATAATWLFLLGNWVEQDYFSPQALSYLMVLGILVLVVGPLGQVRTGMDLRRDARDGGGQSAAARAEAAFALAAVLVLSFGVAVTHQLTAVILVLQLCVVAVFRRLARPELVLVVAFIVTAWFVLGADEFWRHQLALATQEVGRGANVSGAVTDRLTGVPEQLYVKLARLGLSVLVLGLGVLGVLRRRPDRWLLSALALCTSVFVLLQGYGGEIGLRVYFFGLPFLAILAGPVLAGAARKRPVLRAVAVLLVLVVGAVGLVVLRGGNDAYSYISARQVTLVRDFLRSAPPGETVYWPTPDGPVRALAVRSNPFPGVGCGGTRDPRTCIDRLRPYGIVITRSMENAGVLLDGRPPGWARRLEAEFTDSGRYRVVVDRDETVILVRNPA
jgi:hypothetical protein